ncbi:hypothetical protein FBY35_5641 [Streptomyces sp. SLBN-118]|nr:hypothetical protein FBY35_5641 [Streptomyces sp. SLBN-118]
MSSMRIMTFRRVVTVVAAVCVAAVLLPGSPRMTSEERSARPSRVAVHVVEDRKWVDGACSPCGPTATNQSLSAPIGTRTLPTGGDGFTPILYRPDPKTLEVWNLYHHGEAALSKPKIVCGDATNGKPCQGGPWPKPLNTVPGPLGSAGVGDISTALVPQYVFDPKRPGVLYYPAVTATAVGIGCVDLGNRSNCGFISLQPRGGTPSSVNGIGGVVALGGKVYAASTTGQALCMVMATGDPCEGQPYDPVVPPNDDKSSLGQYNYGGAMSVIRGKIYVTSSPKVGYSTTDGPPVMGCFDPATGTACNGWQEKHPLGADGGYWTYSVFPYYRSGTAIGVCAGVSGPAPVTFVCYDVNGSSIAPPAKLNTIVPPDWHVNTFNPATVTALNGELRSYFPFMGATPGATSCYDWTNFRPCKGFPSPTGHPGVNGGHTKDYGYTHDPDTQCLLGLGDAQVLFSMDPATGSAPCLRSGASATLDLRPFRCDGNTTMGQTYTKASLERINLANVNLAASTATVSDPNGTVVAKLAFSPQGTVDLSRISSTEHPAIKVTAHLVLHNDSDFTGSRRPVLRIGSRGDASRICCLENRA